MLYLFNTTIMPNEGVFVNRKVTKEQVDVLLSRNTDDPTGMVNYISALGHQGSADAFNAIFPTLRCEINRIPATMKHGDEAIALKLNGRLPEGVILTRELMEEIGYEFYHVTNIGAAFNSNGDIINSAVGYLAKNGDSQYWVHKS